MHIVFAVDNNYAPYIAPQIYRINQTGTKIDGIKVIISEDVTESILESILLAGDSYAIDIEIIKTSVLDALYEQDIIKDRTHVSYFTYVKLFLPDLLPQLDQILYLDVDILIRNSLNDLLEWELNNPIGAISELSANGRFLFGSHNISYFNAGVMKMSLAKCREINLTSKALKLIQEAKNYNFQDQDIFNLVFRKNFDHLPIVFNVFHDYTYPGLGMDVFRDPIIVHFNGPNKPWNRDLKSKYATEWRKTFQISGLSAYKAEVSLLEAQKDLTPVEAKKFQGKDTSQQHNQNSWIISRYVTDKVQKFFALVSRVKIARIRIVAVKKFQEFEFRCAELLSQWIYNARKSRIGTWIRLQLPYSLKKNLNDFIYNVYKNFRGVKEIIDTGLFSRPELPITSSLEIESLSEPLQDLNQAVKGDFIFVISQHRSGTNALFDLIELSSNRFIKADEIFIGYTHERISHNIMKSFPWFRDLLDFDERIGKEFKKFFRKMDEHAIDILQMIRQDEKFSNQLFVVKIFPTHLSSERFEEVMQKFASHAIILRRTMLYSYISNYKAVASGHWWGKDSSKTRIQLNEEVLRKYVIDSDSWFDTANQVTKELRIPVLHITYDGLYESREDEVLLGKFLENIVDKIYSLETLSIPSRIQDRREEAFLNDLLLQFAELPTDLKRDLLRYPGRSYN